MKKREGFVSNSSSSSFILKVDKTEDGMIKIDPKNFGEAIVTEEELKAKFKEDCLCGEETWEDLDEYDLEKYKKSLKIIESGKAIIMGCVDNNAMEDVSGFFEGLDIEWEGC